MTDHTSVRGLLERMASEVDVSSLDTHGPVKRARRQRSIMKALVAVAVVAIVSLGSIGLRSLTDASPKPALKPTEAPLVPQPSRPVFQRTATIGGLTVTSPSSWFLVDYWGDWNPDATSLDNHAIPLLEVTNFDPGLSTPVCDAGPGRPTRLPADGVAIFVRVGSDGRSARDLCGGVVDTSGTGSVGSAAYTRVLSVGPDVSDADRAAADRIWRSMTWSDALTVYGRGRSPRYVLDGWPEKSGTGLLEALPSGKSVELSLIEVGSDGSNGGDDLTVAGVPRPNPIQGDTFGAVTQDATRVEYHRAGEQTVPLARLIDLPPSLHARFDAYVFEPQPTGGPFEVIAIGAEGQVLGSNLPPFANTSRVGSVRAFDATWNVKLSTAADGYSDSTCVEPATVTTTSPCERGPGGGLLVQTFGGPRPAAFVTELVGDNVTAIELRADDGRVFHAVLVPTNGGSVAVIALEGGGQGRLVYHLSDGTMDQGHRPEAHVTWPDLGQVIGNGSFPSPDSP